MKKGIHRKKALDGGIYYNCLISDCLKELKSKGSCYVFNEEQVAEVRGLFSKQINVKEDNGIFNLTV